MHGIVLLGAPGAGKGTQAVLLSKVLKIPHISSGDLFRENIKNQTELGVLAKSYIDRGELVPDPITVGMVRQRLSAPDCERGFILDGFPRTIAQADALDELLRELNKQITIVPWIRVREHMLLERLSHRWTCRDCGAVFAYESLPPREGCKKDVCTGMLYRREDDTPEVQARRIRVYEEQTAPLIDYYRDRGLLVEINGEHTIEYVHHLLRQVILGAEAVQGR
ncbi:MAG: adenylate kinase [Anaerolineae bacterium]|nr:adenylate kinase [Anaerolineae bacterium]